MSQNAKHEDHNLSLTESLMLSASLVTLALPVAVFIFRCVSPVASV